VRGSRYCRGMDRDGEKRLLDAWDAYCEGLKDLGRRVAQSPHVRGDESLAEGLRHVVRMASMSLTQTIDFADATDPRLFRSNDDVWQWGGPNVDNVYLGAPIDPRGTYRLTGDLSGQPGAILQVLGRPSGDDPIAVRVDRNLVELCDESGRLDVCLSGDASRAADIALPVDGRRLVLREYFPDLDARRAGFVLERLDADPSVVRPSGEALATMLGSAKAWLEQNVEFWQGYTTRRRDEVGVNRMEPLAKGPGMGSESIVYGTGFHDLGDEQCLLVTIDHPRARYWSMQLYSLGWYEAIDVTRRQTSLNDRQAHVDDDGKVRFVVSERDPGTANWLDCAGHSNGMFHFRAVWCDEVPGAEVEVVDRVRLGERMPANHPRVDAVGRARALRNRRVLAQRRFAR